MTHQEMTPEMAEKISEWLVPALMKLTRLDARTRQVFPEGDLFRQRVDQALFGMQQLRLCLHDLERKNKRV